MIRRHTKGEGEIHFEPALRVISGNFVTAKRRGVVDGVDFGYTGEVRLPAPASHGTLPPQAEPCRSPCPSASVWDQPHVR